jgi:ABC-2 type transport system permease protein
MKRPPRPGILLVAARELRWMRHDRVALFLALGVPLIAFALLAFTFSNPVIRNLRVSVVDDDRSSTSMSYLQAIASAPGVQVAERSADLTSAMHAIRSGEAIASVYIPPDFQRDLQSQKRPQIIVFYNRQYLTPGNNASSALSGAINAATASLAKSGPSSTFRPGAIAIEQYTLTNPALNFAQFLLRAVLPTVLHVVVAVSAGYAVGSEFSRRSRRAWLRAAGGSPLAALFGKLAPLFGVFMLMAAVGSGIVHGLFAVPFRGDVVLMGAAACLLVLAYLAVGALFQLLVLNLPLGLSITGIFCSPAFGFAGVGFPILAMNGFARFWGDLLPLRWYIQILFDQAVRGLPTWATAPTFAVLAGIATALTALSWARLGSIAGRIEAYRVPSPAPETVESSRIGGTLLAELKAVLSDTGVVGLIILAPLLYGALYPQPYLGQLLRNLPIAVVDQDHTELSREFIQALEADEALEVAETPADLPEARRALDERRAFGIVVIPEGAERDVLHGRQAGVAAYIDSAYFLVYSRIGEGVSGATQAVDSAIATRGARVDGSLAHAGLVRSSPVELLTEPLFNPTGGYASYVVPAAFVLILQQTLLMGTASLGGIAFERGGRAARRMRGSLGAMLGQALAHLCLAAPGLALYLVILPRVYGFSTLGKPLELLLMAVPFVLAVSFLAQFVSSGFKRRETAVLLFIAAGLPLFFLVGVSWPLEGIPDSLRLASRVLPSTSAIDGLVRINQMGANLRDVSREWLTLWGLAGAYALLTFVATRLVNWGDALER